MKKVDLYIIKKPHKNPDSNNSKKATARVQQTAKCGGTAMTHAQKSCYLSDT